jgi:hypothetical protein
MHHGKIYKKRQGGAVEKTIKLSPRRLPGKWRCYSIFKMKLFNFILNHFWKKRGFSKNPRRFSRRVALAGNESAWAFSKPNRSNTQATRAGRKKPPGIPASVARPLQSPAPPRR